jgi:hypothetical protein
MSGSNNGDINDIRTSPQFRGFSFSNFKKTEVKNQMIENMKKGKVEPACYWCAELICAGHYLDVWECILYFLCKHIHLANPKMAIYVNMRYEVFRNIVSQGIFMNELQLRNNHAIRKLFAEIICNLTLCNKKPSFEYIKINRVEEFDITQMTERLKAPSVSYAEHLFQKKDPKELLIAVNEFAFHLSSESKNMNNACYWIEWMVEFELICKARKQKTKCEPRNYDVEPKYRCDIIWLLWDVIFDVCPKLNDEFIMKVVGALHQLFCIKYTTACAKKRRHLLYFVVALCTESVNKDGIIVADKSILENVISQINNIYKQIKKNEHSPNTEYLFSGVEAEMNFQKTVQKMDLMKSIDIV